MLAVARRRRAARRRGRAVPAVGAERCGAGAQLEGAGASLSPDLRRGAFVRTSYRGAGRACIRGGTTSARPSDSTPSSVSGRPRATGHTRDESFRTRSALASGRVNPYCACKRPTSMSMSASMPVTSLSTSVAHRALPASCGPSRRSPGIFRFIAVPPGGSEAVATTVSMATQQCTCHSRRRREGGGPCYRPATCVAPRAHLRDGRRPPACRHAVALSMGRTAEAGAARSP
jgi:hypothetical protein